VVIWDLQVVRSEKKSQTEKFKERARELEADEDEARWEERLRKVAKSIPEEEEPAD
jgi:hypothetical protein